MKSKTAVEKMIEMIKLDPAKYKIGQTKIFFKAGALAELEEQRDEILTKLVVRLQAHCRGYIARLNSNVGGDRVKAARLIQRNIRKYLQVREWPWWKLFIGVKRLENFSQNDLLAQLRSEMEQWKQMAEEEAARREAVEAEIPKLESEKRALVDALEQEKASLVDCEGQRQRLERQTKELADSLGDQESVLDQQMETAQQLVSDKKGLLEQIEALRAERDEIPVVNPEKVKEMEEESKTLKGQFQELGREQELLEESSRKVRKETQEVKDSLETAQRAITKAEAAVAKLSDQQKEINQEMQKERGGVTDRDALLKQFDTKLSDARSQTASVQAEKDTLQSQSWEFNTQVLVTKSKVEDISDSYDHLERQIKRLEEEIASNTETATSARDSAAIKAKVAELEKKKAEQNQAILELEDSIMLAEQAIPRLEVNINALETKLATTQAQDQDEGRNRALRQQVRDLQEEIEFEKRNYSKTVKAKESVEASVVTLREQVAEESEKRSKFQARLRTMEAKVKDIDEPGEPTGASQEILKYKAQITRYQREIDRDEEALRKIRKEKRYHDDEVENLEEMLVECKKNANDLRRQVKEARQARFREETSVEDSPARTVYKERYTYRKTTTTTTRTTYSDEEDA